MIASILIRIKPLENRSVFKRASCALIETEQYQCEQHIECDLYTQCKTKQTKIQFTSALEKSRLMSTYMDNSNIKWTFSKNFV